MTHVFVVKKSTKSWAYQVEELLRNQALGKKSIVLDFSSCLSWRPISVGRARAQFSIRNLDNVIWIVFRKISLVNLISILKSIEYICKFLMLRKERLPKLTADLAFAQDAILCRLSQTMGTRYFPVSEVPLLYLFRFTREAILGQKSYPLIKSEYTHVTLFNGREPLESVIIRKALDLGLKVNITERASSNLKYENYTISPHYQPEWWDKARSFWEESQPIDTFRRQQINQYLELKSNGFDSFLGQKWSEFYVNQIQDFAEFRPYIVFFTTSTHEYSPIIEYESKLGFSNQFEAAKLLKLVCEEFGYNLIVRRHPNSLSPLDKRDREGIHWDKLSGANTVIFGPKDSVNSIELAKNSHVAFVWRSSVGIETLFRGVPTFALGSARWALDESVRAWSKEKIRKVISNSAQDSNSILEIYANYMANGGQQLKYFVNVNRDFAISNLGDRLYMYLGDRFSIAFRYSVRKFLYRNIRRKA